MKNSPPGYVQFPYPSSSGTMEMLRIQAESEQHFGLAQDLHTGILFRISKSNKIVHNRSAHLYCENH